jgi:hypothetical protein
MAILVLGLGGCIAAVASIGNSVNNAVNSNHNVVYDVTGGGTASNITYTSVDSNGSSGVQQESNVTLPWTKSVQGKGTISVYSLSASTSTGPTISCKITIDGKEIVSKTSTGQYTNVSCTGSPPSSS